MAKSRPLGLDLALTWLLAGSRGQNQHQCDVEAAPPGMHISYPWKWLPPRVAAGLPRCDGGEATPYNHIARVGCVARFQHATITSSDMVIVLS